MSLDWESIRGWGAVAIGAVSAFIGYRRWADKRAARREEELQKKKEADDRRWAELIEGVHDRVSRHDELNREHAERLRNAVLDLYKKDEETKRLILAAETRAADRFEKLLVAVTK